MVPARTFSFPLNPKAKISKASVVVLFAFALIIFSPIFSFGVKLRFDELVLLVLVPFAMYFGSRKSIPCVLVPFVFLATALLFIYLTSQVFSARSTFDVSWIRSAILGTLFYAYYGFMLWILIKLFKRESEYDFVFLGSFYVVVILSFISLLQVWDHKMGGGLGIMKAISYVYPYEGALEQGMIDKAHGYHIKMGGAGRATGSFNGHPILLGDALAFLAIFFIPFVEGIKKTFFYGIVLGALMLTLSRGAWVAYIVGVFFYFSVLWSTYLKENGVKLEAGKVKGFVYAALGVSFFIAFFIATGLIESFYWRIESSFESFFGDGVPVHRVERIWPQALSALSQEGVRGWFLGLSERYDASTDSQYFFYLMQSGVVGIFVYVFFLTALILYGMSWFLSTKEEHRKVYLSYAASLFAVSVVSIVHPVLQGNRLFSLLVLLSILVHGMRELDNKAILKGSEV